MSSNGPGHRRQLLGKEHASRHSLATFRRIRNSKSSHWSSGPRVVDLFAGAGLLSYAFLQEGFSISLAIEKDSRAAETYRRNVGNHVICSDIDNVAPHAECDALIGGPPCQGFSTLGKRFAADPRNNLAMHFVHWAQKLDPQIVVVENVIAFVRTPQWSRLVSGLQRLGYHVYAELLDAADFGVAQKRRRSFTIATRIATFPIRPLRRFSHATVRDAWEGLPRRPDRRNWHYSPQPSAIALARMQKIPPGGGKADLMRAAPDLCPPSWWRSRVELTDVWGRLRWDEPSNTVRTCFNNASKGRYIHPEQNRVISIREAARLQSIPDQFQFSGYAIDAARQIGNGVPPALGCAVARAVWQALSK